ncbi:hypothetical protein GobsT_51290 [Gemmata obscuriglobus]|uniref:Uncharacterized protein n=1 Tax=Gemmata obscuriglobus TaxID=114 RepID=A0A2Z3GUM8_9BACT|nr:hypothetical protein [Gemmata obscuriglobus]AWM36988.1 hypothetical protein C1280_08110 [Gemmata obscuriglobus]QEG30324.1 hypothetical protein GobsT_51290 [Gemmata obscuriglobus]VTS09648.1 unnamed protein product [Gemmata obscuriglobus UQM 2246]
MFDDDDFGIGVLLPWQIGLLIVVCLVGYAIWYSRLPDAEKAEMCAAKAAKLHLESRYDKELDCLVKIDSTHWQKIEKYKRSGIVELQDGAKP